MITYFVIGIIVGVIAVALQKYVEKEEPALEDIAVVVAINLFFWPAVVVILSLYYYYTRFRRKKQTTEE